MEGKDCGRCEKCGKPIKIIWDEDGFGYSTKIWRCEKCRWVAAIEYIEDPGLDVNNDSRWYEYND